MICCKHGLGKIVAFRVRKFGFCVLGFFCCFYLFVCLVFVFYKTNSIANDPLPWLNKAEERNGCRFR